MRARIARLALVSALLVIVVCVWGYVMSRVTDAAPAEPLPRFSRHQDEPLGDEAQATLSDRERPAERPSRSEYDDPARRVRATSIEALLQRVDSRAD